MDLGSRDILLKGGESERPAIVPHDSAKSLLFELVTSDDPDVRMPKEGKKLSDEKIATLKAWIDRGAPWGDAGGDGPKYVAPLEPRRVRVPDGPEANPLDRLLHLSQSSTVDDRLFARRVYLDSIGLLPTSAQVEAFLADSTTDKREKLVASLLADNQKYAEHWMSFWNDCLRNDYQGTGYIDGGRKQITGWLYRAPRKATCPTTSSSAH
jgi:hypothetical protein